MSSIIIALLFLIAISFAEAAFYAWGVNDYGQLGLNGTYFRAPTAVPSYKNVNIASFKASGTLHMAVSDTGDVYVSGNNWYGGLAIPISQAISISYPTKNPDLKGCQVYIGKRHGNAVCGTKFYGWGVRAGYVAGYSDGIYGKKAESLAQFQLGDNVANVIPGSRSSFVVLKNETIFVVGEGLFGTLGLGDTKDRVTFEKFSFFEDNNIPLLKIFPSHAEHTCALSTSYSLYCWGSNSVGQLGLGDTEDRTKPTLVTFFETDHYAARVCFGVYHTTVLTASGKVFVFGSAQNGVLGNGRSDNVTYSKPINLEYLNDKNIVDIVCGLNFNFARTSSNTWYSWGAGSGGVLGLQTDTDVLKPTQCLENFNITYIVTAATSRSVYGLLIPGVPTTITGPPLVNECLTPGLVTCKANAHCVDTERSATCGCDTGYGGNADNCVDIDECLTSSVCVPSATCNNRPGSYDCTCPPNMPIGDGKVSGSGCKAPPPVLTTTTTTTGKSATSGTHSTTSQGESTPSPSTTADASDSSTTAASTSTTGDGNGNGNGNGQSGSTSASSGTTSGNNDIGTTTGGSSQSTTSVQVGSTTRRTNYYQTLGGTKEDLEAEQKETSSDDTAAIKDGNSKTKQDNDKKTMIAVLIAFGVLSGIALLTVAGVFLKTRVFV